MKPTVAVVFVCTVLVGTGVLTAQPAAAAAAAGSAQFSFASSATTIAPGAKFDVTQQVTIAGDTANVAATAAAFSTGSYVDADDSGSAFPIRVKLDSSAGVAYYAGGIASSGISGALTLSTETLRAPCSGSVTMTYVPAQTEALSGVTNTDIPATFGDLSIPVAPLGPQALCVAPEQRGRGGSKLAVTLYGSGFTAASVPYLFNSGVKVLSTSLVSSTQLALTVSVAPDAALGDFSVLVTNEDQTHASCTKCFTISAAPTLSKLSPASVRRGRTTTVTATVSDLVYGRSKGPAIRISGAGVTVTKISAGSNGEMVTFKVASNAALGKRNVTIINPDGGQSTCTGCLTIST